MGMYNCTYYMLQQKKTFIYFQEQDNVSLIWGSVLNQMTCLVSLADLAPGDRNY